MEIKNIQSESLVLGCFYKNPDFYLSYGNLMRPEYDFYKSEEDLINGVSSENEFFYICFENMYKNFSQDFSEKNVNMFMSQDKERFSFYKRLGGYNYINKIKSLAEVEDFKNYYKTLKKYSLLRELFRSGFPVRKIMEHKNFSDFDAEFIQKAMLSKVYSINTVIGGAEESVELGKKAKDRVLDYTKKPSFGLKFPFKKWNESFRGWREKKFIVEGMLSNEGKSRKMVYLAVHTSLIEGESCLIMTNEMSEEDVEACKIVTCINHPDIKKNFNFDLNKTEEEIVLGQYRDSKGKIIQREFGKDGEPRLSDDEWTEFLYENSEEFRNTLKVAEWIEQNTNIYFKEMNGKYSDADLELEIKRHSTAKGVKFFFYDTLKGFKTDQWEAIKQTATRLEEICKELKVSGYANFQLTDDSVYVDIFDYNSNNLANAKQVYHVLDYLCLDKRIYADEYEKYEVEDSMGGYVPMDEFVKSGNEVFYGCKFAKSRTGNKNRVTLIEVDLDRNQWNEIGWLKKKGKVENASMKRIR